MKETLRHQEAFEYYYGLGESRSCRAVADRFTVSETSAKKWKSQFGWESRIAERDAKNAQALAKKTDTTIVAQKAKYLKIVRAAIANVVRDNTDASGNLTLPKTKTARDFTDVVERLTKLDLLLSGEATERTDDMGTVVLRVDDGVDPDSDEAKAEDALGDCAAAASEER